MSVRHAERACFGMDEALESEVLALLHAGQKLAAVKRPRERTGMAYKWIRKWVDDRLQADAEGASVASGLHAKKERKG